MGRVESQESSVAGDGAGGVTSTVSATEGAGGGGGSVGATGAGGEEQANPTPAASTMTKEQKARMCSVSTNSDDETTHSP